MGVENGALAQALAARCSCTLHCEQNLEAEHTRGLQMQVDMRAPGLQVLLRWSSGSGAGRRALEGVSAVSPQERTLEAHDSDTSAHSNMNTRTLSNHALAYLLMQSTSRDDLTWMRKRSAKK